MLSLQLSVVTAGAQSANFSDVPANSPYYTAIMDLKSRGIIGGYPDGTYKPDQMVNRVEALKIILLGADILVPNNTGTGGFSDTQAHEWYAKYLLQAKTLGIVNGYPDGTFKPTQTVNLVENLKMLINARNINLDKVVVSGNPYADAMAAQWYAKFVEYAKEQKWLTPDSKNMIYPAQGMTRGKLAQLLYNSLKNTPMNVPAATQQTQQPTLWNTQDALVVNIQNMQFVKNSMTVAQGAKVAWVNKDNVSHTITSDDGKFTSSTTLDPGQVYIFTFNNLGTFTYHCSLHPTMKGTIIVKPAIEVPTI